MLIGSRCRRAPRAYALSYEVLDSMLRLLIERSDLGDRLEQAWR